MRWLALLLLPAVGCAPAGELHDDPELLRGGLLAGFRPTSPSASLPRFEADEWVELVVSPGGGFRLHFTRSGPNAVLAADADGNGVPDAVDVVGQTYDRVAAFYATLGYLPPLGDSWLTEENGGDGLFDVYLVDFAGRADGAFRLDDCQDGETRCTGHMLQENDFAGYSYRSYAEAVDTLASHEFFHAVQAAYRPSLGSIASEGTAVWATERFSPALEDLEQFSSAYMDRPDRSLVVDPDGPASFAYGSSLFFQFLSERFGDRLLLSMWEESVRSPAAPWPELVDTALRREWSADFDTAFAEFAQWNLSTGSRARQGQGYARGEGYAELFLTPSALPVDEPSVRVAPASTRYFEVAGGAETLSVSFQPTDDAEPGALHLLVATEDSSGELRVVRADGPGSFFAQVSAADAPRAMVAVVDGRLQGLGRYGRLCIADFATDTPCERASNEAPEPDGGCQSAPGGVSWALLLLFLLGGLRREAARVPSGAGSSRASPPCRSRRGTAP